MHLQQQKFSRDDIVDAGLAFVNKANKLQDQFRGRLMFPIFDSKGEPVGFGGRTLGDDGPKYKNSPETSIYQKSRLLYGLNWAKAEVVARGQILICEGYTDVMAFALAGEPNAVATCGTALADDHFQIIKNLARKVILAYDSDAAGQGAAERWYEWEQRYDIQLEVADLPAGRDPADVWRDDPAAAASKAVEAAKPFMEFRIDRVLAAADSRASRVGPVPARPRPRSSPSTRATSCATSTSCGWRPASTSTPIACATRSRAHGAGRAAADELRACGATPARRRAPRRVDRREVDLLLYAVHDPALVEEWLDARCSPTRSRAPRSKPSSTPTTSTTRSKPPRVRCARCSNGSSVEEPGPTTSRRRCDVRLVANAVGPAAQRVVSGMLARGRRTIEHGRGAARRAHECRGNRRLGRGAAQRNRLARVDRRRVHADNA